MSAWSKQPKTSNIHKKQLIMQLKPAGMYQAGQDMVGVPAGMTLEQYRALEKIANRLQSASPKLFTSSV